MKQVVCGRVLESPQIREYEHSQVRLNTNITWDYLTMTCLIGVVILRCLYLHADMLELVADEAYYWDWSRHLSLGYYSKPPLIAWVIHLTTSVWGDTHFGIRISATFFSAMSLYAVYGMGKSFYSPQVGFYAMLATLCSPGEAVVGQLMTIDAPFHCFWSWGIWSLGELLFLQRESQLQTAGKKSRLFNRWTFIFGLSLALGILSKQTMLALFVMSLIAVCCLIRQRHYQQICNVLAGLAIGCLGFIPTLVWNWQNQWVLLHHTKNHFQTSWKGLLQSCIWGGEFMLSQAGLMSPVIWGLIMMCGCQCVYQWRILSSLQKYLLSVSLVPIVAVFLISFTQRVQPNWSGNFYPTAIVLMTGWVFSNKSNSERLQKWLIRGVLVGLVMAGLTLMIPLIGQSRFAGKSFDISTRFRGWKELAAKIHAYREEAGITHLPMMAATARGPVSLLAFYLPDQPQVVRWNASDTIDSQHDLWRNQQEIKGKDFVIITSQEEFPALLKVQFSEIDFNTKLTIPLGHNRRHEYSLWKGLCYSDHPLQKSKQNDGHSTN